MKYNRNQKNQFNYRDLKDKVADNTKWTPDNKITGINRRIRNITNTKIEMKVPIIILFIYSIFTLVGIIAFVVFTISFYEMVGKFSPLIGLLFGGIFIYFGIKTLIEQSVTATFDKEVGYFWLGRNKTRKFIESKIKHCPLSDIYAIQLIHNNYMTLKSNSNKTYHGTYEMNLILKNSNRIQIFNRRNRKKSQSDAKKIADFLGVYYWDTTVG